MNQPPLILVVDDEADFREIFGTKLRAAGFRVETAEDGVRGIDKAKKTKPDLILMDLKMPGMNGAGAVMQLKSDPTTKDIKIVFLTNFGDPRTEMQEADRHFSKEIGAADYIKKSENLDDLVDRVRVFLR